MVLRDVSWLILSLIGSGIVESTEILSIVGRSVLLRKGYGCMCGGLLWRL
jgi:hypothetical protein